MNNNRKDPNQSNKMQTYGKVKTTDNYRCEDHLHQVTNIQHRTTMTKLRLSNYRVCPLCMKQGEDEKHFLVSSPVYQEKRKSLFESLYKEFKIVIVKMSTEKIFLQAINTLVIMLSYRK